MSKSGLIGPKLGTNVLILGTFVLSLASCAHPAPAGYKHWLTDEEDASLRKQCEGKDCVMVPGYLWQQIIQVLDGVKI